MVEHEIVKFKNSSTSALKATSLNSGALLMKKELLWQLNIDIILLYIVVIMWHFTATQKNAQYIAQQFFNCDIKAKNKF